MPAPRMLQLLDQWEDDTLLTMLRVLGAASVPRKQQDVDVNVPVSRLLGKAAERLANPRVAAGYEQQLARLQRSSQLQHAAQPLLSVKELAYVALALQYELLQYNVSLDWWQGPTGWAVFVFSHTDRQRTLHLCLGLTAHRQPDHGPLLVAAGNPLCVFIIDLERNSPAVIGPA